MGKDDKPIRQSRVRVIYAKDNAHVKSQIRCLTRLPKIGVRRKILLPRPKSSSYDRPITAWLFFGRSEQELSKATELILDFPGGGFVAMTPEHHEERLRMWAVSSGRPVLSIEYGKAPECKRVWLGVLLEQYSIYVFQQIHTLSPAMRCLMSID